MSGKVNDDDYDWETMRKEAAEENSILQYDTGTFMRLSLIKIETFVIIRNYRFSLLSTNCEHSLLAKVINLCFRHSIYLHTKTRASYGFKVSKKFLTLFN
jgi:hypothetical protein